MSIFESIVNHFNAHLEATASSIESLTPYIAEAAHLCAHVLLEHRKIICVSSTSAQALSSQFTNNLITHMHIERPSLPAINLQANHNSASSDNYARQIQALGQSDDLLLVISSDGEESALCQAVETAKDCGLKIVVIGAGQQQKIQSLVPDEMVYIQLPHLDKQQALSIQFLIIQLLSELIELQLFSGLSE